MTREKQRLKQITNSDRSTKTRIGKIPDIIWAPVASGILMLLVGLLGLTFRQPWLFPSLGPTAFLQVEQPDQKTAKFYNTVVGHLCGLFGGILAVTLVGATNASSVLSSNELTPPRMWASVLAIALNMLFGLVLKASHPPAAATTLLVSLGGFKPTISDITHVVVGVLIVAIAGEILRQIRFKSKSSEANHY